MQGHSIFPYAVSRSKWWAVIVMKWPELNDQITPHEHHMRSFCLYSASGRGMIVGECMRMDDAGRYAIRLWTYMLRFAIATGKVSVDAHDARVTARSEWMSERVSDWLSEWINEWMCKMSWCGLRCLRVRWVGVRWVCRVYARAFPRLACSHADALSSEAVPNRAAQGLGCNLGVFLVFVWLFSRKHCEGFFRKISWTLTLLYLYLNTYTSIQTMALKYPSESLQVKASKCKYASASIQV